jgi:hypothetical protein
LAWRVIARIELSALSRAASPDGKVRLIKPGTAPT